MVLAFASKRLRALCEDSAEAEMEFGSTVAAVLRHRLADMDAASSPMEMIAGSPAFSRNGDQDFGTVCLKHGFRIEFVANHPKNPHTVDRTVDWSKVNRIKITGILR